MAPPHLTNPPAHGRLTDSAKAGAVLALHKTGINYSGILKETGVKRQTAAHIVERAQQRTGVGGGSALQPLLNIGNINSKPKSGRPEAVSARSKRYLIRTAEKPENRRCTLVELVEEAGLKISHETARTYLNHDGLHWRRPRRKPILTKDQKRKRLEWCKAHKNTDWSRWIFTDEMSIVPGQVRGRHGVWRRVGEEYAGDKGTVHRKKKAGSSVMFWSAICYGIPGPHHVWIPETVKEKRDAAALLEFGDSLCETSGTTCTTSSQKTGSKT